MKKLLLLIGFIILFFTGFSQTYRGYTVEALYRLEAKSAFIIDLDTFYHTTQLSGLDSTLVTLGYLQSLYEPKVTAGTTLQYRRGDKTWQALNTSVVPELTNLYYTDTRVAANSAVALNTAKVTNATHSGDATGATALTLATVNSNVGTYNNITINAKGLATAGSNVSYEVPLTFSTGLSRTGNTVTNTITQYTNALARGSMSLTTTGSSGASTYVPSTGVLNIPTYTLSGLGGQPQLSGTGFVKASGTTISYDNNSYYYSGNSNSTGVNWSSNVNNSLQYNLNGVNINTIYAPTSGSANYIQNQNSSAQTANIWINGNGTFNGHLAAGASVSSVYRLLTTNVQGNIGIRSDASAIDFTRNGTNYVRATTVGGSFAFTTNGTGFYDPVLILNSTGGATFASTVTHSPATLSTQSATLGQVQSGFAPISGSANYIQNQNTSAQSANMWISGNGIFQGGLTIYGGIDLANSILSRVGQIRSTVATGTAPFTVASTTLVSNLNADLFDNLNSSTFVYGTSNFATKALSGDLNDISKSGFYYGGGINRPTEANHTVLHSHSTIDNYSFQLASRFNKLWFRGEENSVWSNWGEIYHSGNSNITSINWNSNINNSLQYNLNGANINTAGTLSNVAYINKTTNTFTKAYGITSRFGLSSASLYNILQTKGIYAAFGNITDGVDNTFGNLYGIGYSYGTLGGAAFSGTHNIVLTTGGTVNTTFGLDGRASFASTVSHADATLSTQSATLGQVQGAVSGTTNYVAKFTGSNVVGNSSIFDNGNVGIGTTTPASLLHILNTGAVASSKGIILENTTANVQFGLYAGINGVTSSGFSIYDKTNVTNRLVIDANGNVGIGTTAPAAKLDVEGNLILQNGTAINEFSTDATMAGYSDLAVPTEKAVVDYVSGQLSNNSWNDGVQTLSGTTVTWNATNGANATLSLTGATTLTLSNLVAGKNGTITVTNGGSVSYRITLAGYTFKIHSSIRYGANVLAVSGGTTTDSFSWYYDGNVVTINGGLNFY